MREDRKQWEGQVINGKFPLIRYLGGTGHSDLFLTERREGEVGVRAVIKLRPATGESNDILLSRWQQAAMLSHPHLIRIFDSGLSKIGNIPVLFVVMEYAGENLAEVLSDRVLTPDEAEVMLESILEVLAILHGKGFAHGHLKPSNIMAVDEQLKVSCDDLRRTGEEGNGPGRPDAYDPPEYALGLTPATQAISPAGDVWSLGVTLAEALTGELPDVSSPENCLKASLDLPRPFANIVGRCLVWDANGRWTVTEIAAYLRNPIPTVPAAAPNATPTPVASPSSSPLPLQPVGRPPKPSAKAFVLAGLVAAGLAVIAIPVGIKLLNLSSAANHAPRADAVEQPATPDTANVASDNPKPDEPKMKGPARDAALEKENSRGSSATPAVLHPETASQREAAGKVELSSASTSRGEVVQRVLPDVPQSASGTIQGTVRVSVHVDVDRSGTVQSADLVAPSVSKYFERQAVQAAQRFRFLPPKVSGESAPSTWTLRFEFTRDGTTVTPTQETP